MILIAENARKSTRELLDATHKLSVPVDGPGLAPGRVRHRCLPQSLTRTTAIVSAREDTDNSPSLEGAQVIEGRYVNLLSWSAFVPTENPTQWMTTAEAAEYLRVTPHHLSRLRRAGKGPRWHSPAGSKTYRYLQSDLDAWLQGGVS